VVPLTTVLQNSQVFLPDPVLSLISVLEGPWWSMPCPGHLTLKKETCYALYRRLGGLQGWSGMQKMIHIINVTPAGMFRIQTLVLQITGVAAAIDATKEPAIAARYNIRGYPTVKYFKAGEFAFDVNVRDAAKITEFMRDPREPPPPPPPEIPWSEEPSEVVHLTEETFKIFLKKKKHVLVMFYAPCKYSQ